MRILALPLIALAACTVSEDTRGGVYAVTDQSVTIRGVYDLSLSSGPARPTQAMIAQAQDVCPDATYLSASPSPTDDYTFLYLFRC
jgi:hypothetical protein